MVAQIASARFSGFVAEESKAAQQHLFGVGFGQTEVFNVDRLVKWHDWDFIHLGRDQDVLCLKALAGTIYRMRIYFSISSWKRQED